MKRKYLMAVLACSLCLTAAAAQGMAAGAAAETKETVAETEEIATEAVTEASEDATETAQKESEAGTEEAETEEETEQMLERPEYNALDYVKLGDYKNLEVNRADLNLPESVTDEDVNDYVENSIKNIAMYTEGAVEAITEGTVEDGDIANIDYVGKKDDVAFDGGTAEGYDLTIGSGTFIEGFEEGLIGAKIGDTVDLNLTFPENYGNEELAGQEVVFTVTVNSVKRMPEEITDDLVNKVTNGDYSDIASYSDYVRSYLEEDLQQQVETATQEKLFSMLQESSEVTGYPEGLQEYTEQFITEYYKGYAKMYNMEFSDFITNMVGITEEQFQEEVTSMAEENMQMELYFNAILASEEIEITDADYETLAQNYGYESVEAMYESGESTIEESAYLNVIQNKALEVLMDNVTMNE